jgi:hypothetical protein
MEICTMNEKTISINCKSMYAYSALAWDALYSGTLAELRGRFNELELQTILRALMSTMLVPQTAGQHLAADIAEYDFSGDDEPEAEHLAFATALMSKINALTLCQKAMLEIWAVSRGDFPNIDEKIASLL